VLTRHRGFWNRLAHGLIAIPAVIVSNTLRIFALALWAASEGPHVLASAGHLYIAWTTVAVAAALFLAMERLFPAGAVPPGDAGPSTLSRSEAGSVLIEIFL
jgi:exosortase/archaeosortase family protein